MSRMSRKLRVSEKGISKVERLSDIISDIRKPYGDDDNFDLANHIIDYYYTNYYQGCEFPCVSQIYFSSIYIELTIWLGQNQAYFKQSVEHQKVYKNFFKKKIMESRINTYELRENLYKKWQLGKSSLKDPLLNEQELDVLNTLFLLCPVVNDENKERIEDGLDLELSKEKLETKLKRLNK